MSKLTKPEAKMHAEAELLLGKDEPTAEDKEFIFEHWQESANHVNSAAGAFFTPHAYALDVALEIGQNGARIIDLCAGIGTLSYAATQRWDDLDITCVELNPAYVELGRKIVPGATWITGSIFDLPDLGHFDIVISNPPFGRLKVDGSGPRYKGNEFDFKVIDLASTLADYGVFILPNGSAPFSYSGAPYFDRRPNAKYEKFHAETGIDLDIGIGIDSTNYPAFHGTPVRTEVCVTDFTELVREAAEEMDSLFEIEAA
jgi:hypothetical protein